MNRLFSFRTFAVMYILLISISVFGYGSTEINKVWIDNDAESDGEKGMLVHVDLNVIGVKDNTIKVIAYLYDSDKDKLTGGISHYKSVDGQVCVSKVFIPTYNNNRRSDFKLFIPYRALPFSSSTKKYYVKVIVRDKTQNIKLSKNEKYFSFLGNKVGGSHNYKKENERHNHDSDGKNLANNGGTKTWKEMTTNGFVIVTQFANGAQIRARYRPCLNCKATVKCSICYGTGRCNLCSGQGYYLDRMCASCRGTGFCVMCNGRGKCRCSTTEYPGYVIGSMRTINPDGSSEKESFDYGSGGSSITTGGGERSTCYLCGGTGIDPNPSSGGSRTSWIGYVNSSGNVCPYCKYSYSHQHTKCTHCNVPRN